MPMPMPDIDTLLNIGIALSAEKDTVRLLERILDAAMDITHCDGGTLYILRDDALWFTLLKTKSKGSRQGFDGESVDLPPVPLSGSNDCARAAAQKIVINVPDIYTNTENDYSGTKQYDLLNHYKTTSILSVPMENDRAEIIGVLQLVNAMDAEGNVAPFAVEYERIIFSLASQAAICLTNRNYANEVTALLDSFVRVMSTAIDARSPYNANHTRNMARYGQKFVAWLNETGAESFAEDRERQLLMSVWLHDIGKLVVPLEIMDKESRLGDKIHAITNRFLVFDLQNQIQRLEGAIDDDTFARRAQEIAQARTLVQDANVAGYLSDEMLEAVTALGARSAQGPFGEENFLTQDELDCLFVRKGTLTDDERHVIESHVTMTRRMLSEMRFPDPFRPVPGWASAHHEFLNGKGYPDGIKAEEIPLEVRILTILDVYDALTARDRPYKPAIPADRAFGILHDMAGDGQIDKRLLQLFQDSEAWKEPDPC